MGNATNRELGELHGKLAKAMLKSLEASDRAADLLQAFAGEMPEPVEEFLSSQAALSPALLTAVAKFLKDNDISASIEDDQTMTDLQARLKSKRRRVGNVVPIDEDE